VEPISSGGVEQLVLRAGGGVFVTNVGGQAEYDPTKLINTAPGAYLSAGGAWTNASDSSLKENYAAVDGDAILTRLGSLPIRQWNYKAEDETVRHIGPTAQDFHDAFGLGADDKSLSTVDPVGVALAAIQQLHVTQQQLLDKAAEVDQLREEVSLLRARLEDITAMPAARSQP
jgi:hypothetical protein